jgi:hypothetical protein
MSRPFTDITNATTSTTTIKNGSVVVSCSVAGEYSTLDTSVSNLPAISDIDDKYGYRFYNGLIVINKSGTL